MLRDILWPTAKQTTATPMKTRIDSKYPTVADTPKPQTNENTKPWYASYGHSITGKCEPSITVKIKAANPNIDATIPNMLDLFMLKTKLETSLPILCAWFDWD